MRRWIAALTISLIALSSPLPAPAAAPSSSTSPAAATAPTCPTLQRGSAGKSVEELQYRLRLNGWVLAVDGQFGPRTEYIVTRFQQMSGLYVDGIAGPHTQRALGCGVYPSDNHPERPVAPRVNPAPGSGDRIGRWHDVAIAVGWSEADWPWLSCVIRRESNGDPSAYNGRGNDRSYGLVQLNTKGSLWSWYVKQGLSYPQQLLDGATNLRIAKVMHAQMGKRPWRSSSKPC